MIVVLKHQIATRLVTELAALHVIVEEETRYSDKGWHGKGRHKGSLEKYSKDDLQVDLSALTKREATKLAAVLRSSGIHGAAVPAVEIERYLKAAEVGVLDMKARTCRQAAWMLERFIGELPHHMLFSTDAYGGKSHSGYYVADVDYEPAKPGDSRRDRQEEYCDVEMAYIDKDERHKRTLRLSRGDCLFKTVIEILGDKGYVPETPALMAKLVAETERYYQEVERIGHQYNAVGIGLLDLDDVLDGDDHHHWFRRNDKIKMDQFGSARVVIDVLHEDPTKAAEDRRDHSTMSLDPYRWHKWNSRFHAPTEDELVKHMEADEDVAEPVTIHVPVHPLVPCFDLERHKRLRVHVNNLTKYEYNKDVGCRLVLPERDWQMVNLLVDQSTNTFEDIVGGKGRSMNILAAGPPGMGKTVTAEVFSEFKRRPLYTVQCAQLGLQADEVEGNLSIALQRANRWNAVLLLDEADVYISKRGTDLIQNAIVGAFLRVLEYASCILFMTTNLGDMVDDAITSRCIAKLTYGPPEPADQARIWRILADLNHMKLDDSEIRKVVKAHPKLSGRDVKNLLKLASFVAKAKKQPLTAEAVEYALQFKPTE